MNNKDIDFHHSFEASLKMKIFRMFSSYKISKRDDVLVVIRSDKLLDGHVETDKLYYTKNIFSKHFTKEFLDYELYPKIRAPKYNDHNLQVLFSNIHSSMLIYITDENTTDDDVVHFKDGVKKLPRKMIFTISDSRTKEFSTYLSLFKIAGEEWEGNTVYGVHVNEDKTVTIDKLEDRVSEVNIVNFTMAYYKRKVEL